MKRRPAVLLCGMIVAFAMAFIAFVSAASATGTPPIPFQPLHGLILVHARIDGRGPYTFLIDTDTTPSAVDLRVVRELRLSTREAGTGSGIGSEKVVVYPVKLPLLQLGQESAKNLDALAADLSGLSQAGTRIDGVLGTSFLNGRILQVNYACRAIRFLSKAPATPYTVRFRPGDSGDNLFASWVGSNRASATFDSGNNGDGFVTARGIADLHLEHAAATGQRMVSRGYLGPEAGTIGKVSDIRIGSVQLGALQMQFLPKQRSSYDLDIGNHALKHYSVVMDYKDGLLTLGEPGPCSANGK